MKKVLEFITNPLKMLAVCGVCFGVAFVDSVMHDASSMADLSIVGKVFTGIFMVAFTALVIRYGILPIYRWLISLVQ
jgi:hypothetical protein